MEISEISFLIDLFQRTTTYQLEFQFSNNVYFEEYIGPWVKREEAELETLLD